MKHLRRTIRAVMVTLLLLAVGLPTALYVILSTPLMQQKLCRIAANELSELLGTEVRIGTVALHPFNRVTICDVEIDGDDGSKALSVDRLTATFEVMLFINTRRLAVDYVVIEGLDGRIRRATPDSPLNIQNIINRLKGDGNGPKAHIDLQVSTASILDSRMSYDVLSAPAPTEGRFCPDHVAIDHLRMLASAKISTPDNYFIRLTHFEMQERSGLVINDMDGVCRIENSYIDISPLAISFGESNIRIDNGHYTTDGTPHGALTAGGTIRLSDLRPFLPELGDLRRQFNFSIDATTQGHDASLRRLSVVDADNQSPRLLLTADASDIGGKDFNASLAQLRVELTGNDLAAFASKLAPTLTRTQLNHMRRLGSMAFTADGSYSTEKADLAATLSTPHGHLRLTADGSFPKEGVVDFGGVIDLDKIELGELAAMPDLDIVDGSVSHFTGRYDGRKLTLDAVATFERLDFKGYSYHDLDIGVTIDGRDISADLIMADKLCNLDVAGALTYLGDGQRRFTASGNIGGIALSRLNLLKWHPGTSISAEFDTDVVFSSLNDTDGHLSVNNLQWVDSLGTGLHIKHFDITTDPHAKVPEIRIDSDVLTLAVDGRYSYAALPATLRSVFSSVMPAVAGETAEKPTDDNDFNFFITLTDPPGCGFSSFFGLPVELIAPVTAEGYVSDVTDGANITINAPYLLKGNNLIENTTLHIGMDRGEGQAIAYATTRIPTNKGIFTPVVTASAAADRINTRIDWEVERQIPLNGVLAFSTDLYRNINNALCGQIGIEPGEITFGNELWRIAPSKLNFGEGRYSINGFSMATDTQAININGKASHDPSDIVTAELSNINLIEIFETLEIQNVYISGSATGTVMCANLLSGAPELYTDNLHVIDIGYNYCTIGDADVTANFNSDDQSIYINGQISQPGGHHSQIIGSIWPTKQRLELNIDAEHVPAGFLQPIMQAFAEDVHGYASGHARLFGGFKEIDLEGDVFAEDFGLKVAFTNVAYSITDSVHMRPGHIEIPPAKIYDTNGNTAMLTGSMRHRYFQDPVFDFHVSDARDFLCYNTTERNNPDWYGTVYGTGSASISGHPGVVTIEADMTTDQGSVFSLVLNDRVDAEEMSFITFRDRTVVKVTDSLTDADDTPQAVKEFRARKISGTDETETAFNMRLRVDITPQANVILVMDPVGGDAIRAKGTGNMNMTYGSTDDDLRIYGTYTLDEGSYNFTLQDIIIKDFTIKPGSSISFIGDPYSANLDIKAFYSVNANLSDLDESFLSDPELNRTNVPVHALLIARGDMRQPEISFDLEFPTLQSDTYRKVKSIVSTEEMMNRQIIYLLALNRFYTPDYMASTTKGNELFSVASSTISSQLSNMLGKLSDNWSIAPNLRSDRGDFSDIEVDVMLSSRLLNNRLLFNGNFGYRDKSLNTNQFIGDFDIEYLLNRKGSWRLKAYNRYNDQSYYLRTATTTQGVGILFKHDFDDIFGWLKK